MKITINKFETYSEAVIENMPVMTITELDELTEALGVDVLVF